MGRVADLVRSELITVITTDLTVTEVAKRHAENDFETLAPLGEPHFRALAAEFLLAALPQLSKLKIRSILLDKYRVSTAAMFESLSAVVLSIDDIKPSAVFNAYSAGAGFFSGSGKKHQFPDAFIFECLRSVASVDRHVIIVSNDGDFSGPASSSDHITAVKDIPALFRLLGYGVDAPDVEDFLDAEQSEVISLFNSELNNWGLLVSDVEDAEIDEATVSAVGFRELVSFGVSEDGGDILVVGKSDVTAAVSYTHPDWDGAAWDSEDKVLVPFDNVSGETEVEFEVDFSMTIVVGDDKRPSQIYELRFRNSNFQYVEIAPWEDPRF